ncbi:hypothetical protein ASD21_22115 [Caulobacter sp. Root1455]|nr:hypothetical protein ASD38_22160 [Caulobacter sp. Root487D2Y]KQZ02655.1 hypothetical protein ASD21_22115 [Caulobacter sp. Root1455]
MLGPLQPEFGAVGTFVVEEAAALQNLKHRPCGRITQLKAMAGLITRLACGLDELHEGQVHFGDAADIDKDRRTLPQGRAQVCVSCIYI